MEIVQIAGLGLVSGILIILIRQSRPELALLLSMVAGAIVFLTILPRMASLVGVIEDLAFKSQLSGYYLGTVLKVIGVAYITEFSAQVLRDAREEAVAHWVELAGKVLIMVMAVPIILAILETVSRMLR